MRKLAAFGAVIALTRLCGGNYPVVVAQPATSLQPSKQAELPTNATPEQFLKWSMDKYKAIKTLDMTSALNMNLNGEETKATRTLLYAGPNKFKIVSTAEGSTITTISDGTKLVEYLSDQTQGTTEPAPASISLSTSKQMNTPLYGTGSLINEFFDGSINYENLVWTSKSPVTMVGTLKVSDEVARIISFYGRQSYGHVKAVIGETTGKVYSLAYDMEPMVKQVFSPQMKEYLIQALAVMSDGEGKKRLQAEIDKWPKEGLPISEVKETFGWQDNNVAFTVGTFDTTPPKNLKLAPAADAADKPPVALGQKAPDVAITDSKGKAVKLSSFRGKVVLVDFWATWCGPCRIGLPETEKLAKESKGKNLQVIALSDEDRRTVDKFMKENRYTMPSFIDPKGAANKAYKITGIPTTAIIDANGNLAAYFVGLTDADVIREALMKAGAKL